VARAAEGRDVTRVAALFVARGGIYFGREDVEPWDESRDARLYAGPWPVDDGGCFAAALASVRKWGGVLEHPEASAAWAAFGLIEPPRSGGWVVADFEGGWTCCVAQGHYGHRAQKFTWLYTRGVDLPSLRWGASVSAARLDQGFHSAEERARFRSAMGQKAGVTPEDRKWGRDCYEALTGRRHFARLSARERSATPPEFAELLLSIARSARVTPSR
jgi:hypothetical protein